MDAKQKRNLLVGLGVVGAVGLFGAVALASRKERPDVSTEPEDIPDGTPVVQVPEGDLDGTSLPADVPPIEGTVQTAPRAPVTPATVSPVEPEAVPEAVAPEPQIEVPEPEPGLDLPTVRETVQEAVDAVQEALPVEIPTVAPAPPPGPPPPPEQVEQPSPVPADTARIAAHMLAAESRTGWKRREPELAEWQRARGLVADQMFGPKSALAMAEEIGTVPLIRFWPSGSQPHTAVPEFRANLELVAEAAEEPRATQLRASAARETGQAYQRNPGPPEQRFALELS